MHISKKSRRIIIISIIAILLFVVYSFHSYMESSIRNYLATETPKNLDLEYKDLKVNILSGAIFIENISGRLKNQGDDVYASFDIDKLGVTGFSIWQFFINNEIRTSRVILDRPIFRIANVRTTDKNIAANKALELKRAISIGEIQIEDGSLELLEENNDNLQLRLKDIDFEVQNVRLDSSIIQNKIPFEYDDYTVEAHDIFFKLSEYESLRIDSLNLYNNNLKIHHLVIATNHNRQELSNILKKERDHITLDVNEVLFNDLNFGFNDKRFLITANLGEIKLPDATIYRDKLVADDLTIKRLYSHALRELPIDIFVNHLLIRDGELSYEELVDKEAEAGRIYFDQINADIFNLVNYNNGNEKIIIETNAMFMKSSPMTLEWSFDVNDTHDRFTATGTFKDFDAQRINPFLESNMRSRAKGTAQEIYFTISGDGEQSTGNMKMKYKNFEFVILKKNRLGINKVLTAIGNIFIKENSKTDEKGYRYGNIEVARDSTKSFFNYLWLNVKNGIGSTLIGNGEKE